MSNITLRVPEEVKRQLEDICAKEGVDMSTLVRESLQRLIALHRFKQLRQTTLPFSERAGVFADEDVLAFKS